ncbi:MAG: transposase family protein [Bacteroidota bacterium]
MQGVWQCTAGKIAVCGTKKSYTRRLERYVNDLLDCMTIQDAAHNLQMSWNTVKVIQKQYLQRYYGSPRLKEELRLL